MGNKQGILNYSDEIKIFSTVCDTKFLEYLPRFCQWTTIARYIHICQVSMKIVVPLYTVDLEHKSVCRYAVHLIYV